MDVTELRAWRKALRGELIEKRMALSEETLIDNGRAIDAALLAAFPDLHRGVVGLCWPHKNEYDARYIARTLRARGATTALPVVVAPKLPLLFREWHPGTKLVSGVYDIPYPVDTAERIPDSVLLPMNGFDDQGYRLGYGGGFFDRTLASLPKKPLVIGVTFELARIPTIDPQTWDIPVDYVATERGIYKREAKGLVFIGTA